MISSFQRTSADSLPHFQLGLFPHLPIVYQRSEVMEAWELLVAGHAGAWDNLTW
jgi:hypothetical protein